ncbi:DUF423 domain-containing protein [Caenispirillum bisanense]|uniref:DUF423 domain-containing protein n=1 Tax=Caenispirillum bisanense TaxID=414052 RepID=UPI0031CDCEFA
MRPWMILAGGFGALAVATGAFAAHVLQRLGDTYAMGLAEKAAHYMLWHALALGLVAVVAERRPDSRPVQAAGMLFTLGIVLFCGSLLTLAFTGWRPVAMVAPFGGSSFILGWLALGWAAARRG